MVITRQRSANSTFSSQQAALQYQWDSVQAELLVETRKVRVGSRADEIRSPVPRLLLRVKQSKSASTSAFGGKLAVAEGAPGQPLLANTRHEWLIKRHRTLAHCDAGGPTPPTPVYETDGLARCVRGKGAPADWLAPGMTSGL
jgi:hypothetical protein